MTEIKNIENDLKMIEEWVNSAEELKGRQAEKIAKDNVKTSVLQLMMDVEQLRTIICKKFDMNI